MAQGSYPYIEYTVRSGDTPAEIARRFGVSERELPEPGDIVPGRTVKISCPAGVCARGAFYVIRRGDTLLRIAQRAGLTMKQLLEANPYLNPGRYMTGQVIVIPVTRGGAGMYTLQPGERLFDVLRRLRVDITTFCGLNPGLKPMDVRPGQTIRIPQDDAQSW